MCKFFSCVSDWNDKVFYFDCLDDLDFQTIIPQLIIKPIIRPFVIVPPEITQKHIDILKQWARVWDSAYDSIWESVGASVGESVRASVFDIVGDCVWDDSTGASAWEGVVESVRASVWAYIGSFFKIAQWKYIEHKDGGYPFQPAVDLWELGLVPSYDGDTWRLHGGHHAEVVWEGEL